MGYHSLLEISHDELVLQKNALEWALAIKRALGSNTEDELPRGVRRLRLRHSSEPCSVRDRPQVSNEQIRVITREIHQRRREMRTLGYSPPILEAQIAGLEGIENLLRLLQKTDIHPKEEGDQQ